MARSKDITGEELDAIVEEEKKLLKKDRVYIILELDDRGKDLFSMFCLDTTTNNKDGSSNICQVIGRGVVDLISYSGEEVHDLGKKLLEQDVHAESNVISLDYFRNQEYRNNVFEKEEEEDDVTQITFSFEGNENGDEDDGR